MEALKTSSPVQPVTQRADEIPAERARDPALIRCLFSHRRGLVVFEPSRVKLADLLVQAVEHLDHRPIAIACSRLVDVGRYTRALLDAGITAIQLVAANIWENQDATVVVGTPAGVEMTVAHASGRLDCLLVTSPRLLLQQGGQQIASQSRRSFCLMSADETMATSELAELKGRLDGTELRIPALGMVQRGVAITWQTLNFSVDSAGLALPALKRRAIWRHPGRNRLVARAAQQAVAGQAASGPSESDRESGDTEVLRTIVAVENLEHATVLQRHHLHWPIVCLRRFDQAGLPGNHNIVAIPERRHQVVGPAIVTMAALSHLEGADVIVRADAGTGTLPFSPEMLGRPFDGSNQLQLLDFKDRSHPILRQRSRERKRAYEADPRLQGTPNF